MTGRKTSESHFAISSLQFPVCDPRSPVSALCFLLGSQRLAQSVYTLPPKPYALFSSWRPLPRGIALQANNSILVESVFHGARPVK